MKSLVLTWLLIFSIGQVTAAEVELLPVEVDIHDQARLQRGAKMFMNYCSGCHSLRFMRYNRMAYDLGLTTFTGEIDANLLYSNLIFTSAKIHDPIENSMPPEGALQWFGRVPPDLSLSARERGASWIYTYLKSFYVDRSRPFGSNNALAPLEGVVIAEQTQKNANHDLPINLVLLEPGEMSEQQFDSALQDLVTFLVYVGEPVQLIRYKIGGVVILFLSVFLIFAYQLKRYYWRNIQ